MHSEDTNIQIQPIGTLRSCFPEKFGIPRQPGLASAALGRILIHSPYDREEAFRGLEGFSHLWLTFQFHLAVRDTWQPTIRPPRLGGNRRIGVFASRSPFRPNNLGLSVVRFKSLKREAEGLILEVSGVDLVDGTPIVDIKPYLPYVDRVEDAFTDWAEAPEQPLLPVDFSPVAERTLLGFDSSRYPQLRALISQLLAQDPRPGYRRGAAENRTYAMAIYDLDVIFRIEPGNVIVENIHRNADKSP
ncbi:tRNA (N6-threonylcarbamoyladenosine(37)-N6)-methyltransferase TrmO [Mangrovitalea sediminis]|uniref:tRNA (N6-threonylcarbamoyladenosine(37)-N6)-methyltransferase TrmO n=1 Tax=Mangrovitalea sediminis TaxID=1982043 RepID=UPI000BE5CFA7|nr:tRNA (N6-threonylcarbamoyladenosine(37)-N6)-methyltransferase TrmO [Mangrovitalea sediminis]